MVSSEGYTEEELDAQAFACTACRCGAVPGNRVERPAMVGEAAAMCGIGA